MTNARAAVRIGVGLALAAAAGVALARDRFEGLTASVGSARGLGGAAIAAAVLVALAIAPVSRLALGTVVALPVILGRFSLFAREWCWVAIVVGIALVLALEAVRPTPAAATSGPRRGLLALAGLAALQLFWWSDAMRPVPARAADADAAPLEPAQPWSRAEPIVLNALNALEVPGRWRDVEVAADVDLVGTSTLEVRLRAPDPEKAEGVALLVGSDPRLATRFVLETEDDIRPIGKEEDPIREGVRRRLTIRAEGDRYSLLVNSDESVHALDPSFPDAGAITLLAVNGGVEVRNVTVTPLVIANPPVAEDRQRTALLAMVAALVVAFFAGRWLAPASGGAAAVAGALVLAVAFAFLPRGDASTPLRATLLVLATALLLAPSVHALRRGGQDLATAAVLGPLALSIAALAAIPADLFGTTPARASVSDRRWSWGALDNELAWFQHSELRAGNTWLARHEIFRIDPPAGASPSPAPAASRSILVVDADPTSSSAVDELMTGLLGESSAVTAYRAPGVRRGVGSDCASAARCAVPVIRDLAPDVVVWFGGSWVARSSEPLQLEATIRGAQEPTSEKQVLAALRPHISRLEVPRYITGLESSPWEVRALLDFADWLRIVKIPLLVVTRKAVEDEFTTSARAHGARVASFAQFRFVLAEMLAERKK